MDFVFTEYTFSLNMNKIYKETFDLCMDTGACAGKLFNSEEKIQTRMYEVIWTNTTASYDENKDMQDKLYNATLNETNKDNLYEMYHEFFTRTTPVPNYVTVMVSGAPVDVLDALGNKQLSQFPQNAPVYTAAEPAATPTYNVLYGAQVGFFQNLLKQFQFDLVVYDMTEEFPDRLTHVNFTKPYTERKQVLNKIRITPTIQTQIIQDIYLRKSVLCLEPKGSLATAIPFAKTLRDASNQTDHPFYIEQHGTLTIRKDCSNPKTMMKFGHTMTQVIPYKPDTPYYEFLKVNLK